MNYNARLLAATNKEVEGNDFLLYTHTYTKEINKEE